MDLKSLEPLLIPIVKQVWTDVIHPELLKLEAGIAQEDLKLIAVALDAALDKIVQAELAKLA